MKTILIAIIACFSLCRCGTRNTSIETSDGEEVWTTVIDSCEYIVFPTYAHYGYSHKGNCSNPIHKCP